MRRASKRARNCLLAGVTYAVTALLPPTAYASTEQQWNFTVYLDDTPIGQHDFNVRHAAGYQTISTRARFDVTFLKVPLFRYRHQNVEQWSNRCLKSITSRTDQNGTLFRVDGATTDTGFRVAANEEDLTFPSCISTFAYWDKTFLQNTRLLNSQTGEYLEVDVEDLGKQSIMFSSTSVPANRYRLTADDLDIELWYSSDGHWLGLESMTSNGRRLRYVIE